MKTNFLNLDQVFDYAKCPFCEKELHINIDSVSGYLKRDGKNLLSINEEDGSLLFTVDTANNQTNFSNKHVKDNLLLFILELQCNSDSYRQTYTLQLNRSKFKIKSIILDEENVLLSGDEKVYWVRNLYDQERDPWTEISSWDINDGSVPKSQFDLDVWEDLFATFKLETQWIEINLNKEKFQEKIENLITFG